MRKSAVVCISLLKFKNAAPAGGLSAKEGTVGFHDVSRAKFAPRRGGLAYREHGRSWTTVRNAPGATAIAWQQSSFPQNRHRQNQCF